MRTHSRYRTQRERQPWRGTLSHFGAFELARFALSRLDREAEAERKLRDLERKVEAFMIAIPQTYGEVKQLTGQWPPCEGHEWDNRTTAENAAWCLLSLLEAERLLKVAREMPPFQHGFNCPKSPHDPKRTGYLHGENDDRAYDVDGCLYCGRCHGSI